jgi:hypothetical protein
MNLTRFDFHLLVALGTWVLLTANTVALEEEDIEIVNYEDNCGLQSNCDQKSHLICVQGTCQCDQDGGFVWDQEKKACVNSKASAEGDQGSKDGDANEGDNANQEDGEDKTRWGESNEDQKWIPEKKDEKSEPESASNPVAQNDNDGDDISVNDDEPEKKEPNVIPTTTTKKQEEKKDPTGVQDSALPQLQQDNGDDNDSNISPDDVWLNDEKYPWDRSEEKDKEDMASASCKEDKDCSAMGEFSKCLPKGVCDCFDTTGQGRSTLLVNGICLVWKDIGADCSNHEECTAFISGPSWCHLDLETSTHYCTCAAFAVQLNSSACLPRVTEVGAGCILEEQCQGVGPMATCGPDATCICQGIMVDGSCVQPKDLGEDCIIDQECQGMNGQAAYCSTGGQCACVEGRFCGLLGEASVRMRMSGVWLLGLGMLVVLTVGSAVRCIILKRNVRYEHLQQV